MIINSVGLLICGKPGIGKSELCLQLIDRGHRLVSDDCVELISENQQLIGRSPSVSQHYMFIKHIGIININVLYGKSCCVKSHSIDLCVELVAAKEITVDTQCLYGTYDQKLFLNHNVPSTIFPSNQLNLSLLVEILCRNHALKSTGYNASADFIKLQNKALGNPV